MTVAVTGRTFLLRHGEATRAGQPLPPPGLAATLRQRAARAEAALAQARLEIEGLRRQAAADGAGDITLARLAETLRWEEAPAALRLVLPLARMIRRAGRLGFRLVHPSSRPAEPDTAESRTPPPRRSLATSVAIRCYLFARPVALPLATRLYALLARLLEREASRTQRRAAAGNSAATANADLLRSIEAAMLTLALQRRDGGS